MKLWAKLAFSLGAFVSYEGCAQCCVTSIFSNGSICRPSVGMALFLTIENDMVSLVHLVAALVAAVTTTNVE